MISANTCSWTARAVEFPLASTIQFYPKQPLDRVRWVAARHKERILLSQLGLKLSDADCLLAARNCHGEDLLRMPVLNPDCVLLDVPPEMLSQIPPWS